MSSNPLRLPPLSSLAAKPPQTPTETQSQTSSSAGTHNYAPALAASQQKQRENPAAKPSNIDTALSGEAEGKENASADAAGEGVISPTSAGWRPNLDRQQSWSQQDRKRMMQSPLMSPKGSEGEVGSGFSSKE